MLTFAITFHNEAKCLRGWFENIKHYTDDIVCTDQESTDESRRIALEYGARVFTTPHTGYCETDRQKLIDESKYDWVMILDADERLPYDIDWKLLTTGKAKAFFTHLYIIDYGKVVHPIPGDFQIRLLPKISRWPNKIHQKPSIPYELTGIPLYHLKTIDEIRRATERYSTISERCRMDAEAFLNNVLTGK